MNRIRPVTLMAIVIMIVSACEKNNTPEASVVINELMAVNNTTAADQNGEYDDWMELFNMASVSLDLSGYFLTDSRDKLSKWRIPEGTTIPAKGFLIFWADKDTVQTGLHTNFRLSSAGEKLFFVNRELLIIDEVEYPSQGLELSFARNPDGKGSFKWQAATFSKSNNIR